jgi:hypothetical protein
MKRIAVLAALLPICALAAVPTLTGLLARVPAVPRDAPAAYAQWVDARGDLKPGAGFAQLERDIQATMMAPATHAAANSIAMQYATPEGQAKLKAMTMEEKMALAQQMQQAQMAQMGGGGATAVSDNDGALLRRIQPNPSVLMIRGKLADIAPRMGQIEQQWQADDARLDKTRDADLAKLPICKSEAGEPSLLSIKGVMLATADKHIALAATYLPKYQALANEKRALVAQEAKSADDAQAAFNQIGNPVLRNQMQAVVTGQVANTAADVSLVLGIVETGSKRAAETVAQKKQYEIQYAAAKGC